MGNDQSQMKNTITFNEKPVEKMTNCLIYEAEENNLQLTVFEEQLLESIPYFQNLSALERNIKVIFREMIGFMGTVFCFLEFNTSQTSDNS